MTLEVRKYRLIKLITSLDDELLISKLEGLLDEGDKMLLNLSKPMREKSDVQKEELTPIEQGYKAMSEDEEREEKAFEWIEGTLNTDEL